MASSRSPAKGFPSMTRSFSNLLLPRFRCPLRSRWVGRVSIGSRAPCNETCDSSLTCAGRDAGSAWARGSPSCDVRCRDSARLLRASLCRRSSGPGRVRTTVSTTRPAVAPIASSAARARTGACSRGRGACGRGGSGHVAAIGRCCRILSRSRGRCGKDAAAAPAEAGGLRCVPSRYCHSGFPHPTGAEPRRARTAVRTTGHVHRIRGARSVRTGSFEPHWLGPIPVVSLQRSREAAACLAGVSRCSCEPCERHRDVR